MTTAETEQARRPRPGLVQDRLALVTGGTRGIGAAICRELADEGAHIAAGYWRDDEDVEKFLASMTADYPDRRITVYFLAADASSYITGQIWAVNGGLDM